jgi:tellurite resistance protein TerC
LTLINAFSWVTYVFGGVLILTALKMIFVEEEGIEPDKNPLIRLVRRFYPITDGFRGVHFFVRENGQRMATPMMLTLVVVESSDVVFAVDSIPAVFAVTRDPFLVFTSNVCAILGLRSLYFALSAILHRFRYLKYSLVFLLAFVGIKMILAHHYPVPTGISLALICTALAAGVGYSILRERPPPSGPT